LDNGFLVTKYDAILVDEGQDLLPNWWNALRKVCKPNGEMLLVADATQDIYGTARSWTDESLRGLETGFEGGNWATLSISYRLPPQAGDASRRFASAFLPRDLVDLPQDTQGELTLYPCKMRWIQTTEDKAASVCVDAILEMPLLADPDILVIPDITFLTPNQNLGLDVVTQLEQRGVKTLHTFSNDKRESRRMKLGFFMGDARVKATTLHRFKGWETRGLVIYTGHRCTTKALALAYTGITRIKRHVDGSYITVVSAVPELTAYGRSWPSFVQK
jgi:superfamily I DNA and RNA helicase